ncbi:hypothetical protein N7455_004450 [Penicillium solitum]|uniref:uncharacterized protein n=1 Tax=Penicillium solitum TaxID=60172 RepID=UPI0032C4536A|nr:hypothetical protein N7455_004450 [Penicillium solitum]
MPWSGNISNYLWNTQSDIEAWEGNVSTSSARANVYLTGCIVPDWAKSETFNASDDSLFTWGKFWPKLAEHFQMP